MPRFAANLSMLFTEVDFPERFAMARAAGFEGVEYLFPYAYPKERLGQMLSDNQLTQVLFNLPPGNWDDGERGVPRLGIGTGLVIGYLRFTPEGSSETSWPSCCPRHFFVQEDSETERTLLQ